PGRPVRRHRSSGSLIASLPYRLVLTGSASRTDRARTWVKRSCPGGEGILSNQTRHSWTVYYSRPRGPPVHPLGGRGDRPMGRLGGNPIGREAKANVLGEGRSGPLYRSRMNRPPA